MTEEREGRDPSAVIASTIQTSVNFYKQKLEEAIRLSWIPPVCWKCYGMLSQRGF